MLNFGGDPWSTGPDENGDQYEYDIWARASWNESQIDFDAANIL